MATISWGKPKIFVAPSGAKVYKSNGTLPSTYDATNTPWQLLQTPVEDSTQLSGTQGDKTEAKIEGGEAEATKYNAATFELAMNVRMALDTGNAYRYLPDCLYEKIGGTGTNANNPDHNKFVTTNVAILLIPEAEDAPGFYCPDASVSIMETYTAADGAMWEITFGLNASGTLKAVNFGQYEATDAIVNSGQNYYGLKAKIGAAAS
jgi:hypothetical protein